MIAQLRGTVATLGEDHVVMDVQGVGYLVQAPRSTLDKLAEGAPALLVVETHVREDRISLYGFNTAAEREWFRQLTTVQGVGPKVGLALLSAMPPQALLTALVSGDAKALTRADGVGPKLAARIVSELKGKVAKSIDISPIVNSGIAVPVAHGPASDAVSALINLGYDRSEAFTAVNRANSALGEAATTAALIKAGLKELSA